MFNSYIGNYTTIEESIKSDSLKQVKDIIELAMGEDFKEYETAWIMEYNIIGRFSAQHYFSMQDKKWHRSKTGIFMYSTYFKVIEPIKTIAQWIIDILGYRTKQNDALKKWIQERDINELYGR